MISVHTLTLQPGVEITFWNEQNLCLFIFEMNAKMSRMLQRLFLESQIKPSLSFRF